MIMNHIRAWLQRRDWDKLMRAWDERAAATRLELDKAERGHNATAPIYARERAITHKLLREETVDNICDGKITVYGRVAQ